MKLETFIEKFDLFGDAPNAVAKMRDLILSLAFQGKLVAQDSCDEPASAFLERLQIEKARLSRERGLKRHKPRSTAADVAALGELPAGWTWSLLGELSLFVTSGSRDWAEHYSNEGAIFVRMGNLSRNSYRMRLDKIQRVRPPEDTEGARTRLASGDILISITGEVGLLGLIPPAFGEAYINQHTCLVRLPDELQNRYIPEYLRSSFAQQQFNAPQRGLKNSFRLTDVTSLLTPVPPLAEQRRIVAKVDELMALCDRLEAQQQEKETRHAALAHASLARFADAPTPANLPFLFHPSYAIPPADLRKSILTLAVQGKLVPQDPNDEPAEETLRRCKVDLKRWAVAADEERQAVPDSWTWIRFAGVGEQRLGKMLDAQKNRGELKPYLRNTNVQWMRFELDDVKDMRVEEREMEELRLKTGDLLICEGGEPGRCAIWRDEVGEMYFQKAIHRVRPCDAVTSEYLALNLQIDCANSTLAGYFTGATIKHLTGRSLAAYPVPLAPLAEQKRIVVKVEQLMALVDELERKLAASHSLGKELLEAVVADLIAANNRKQSVRKSARANP